MGRGNRFLFDADFFRTEKSVLLVQKAELEGEAIYIRLLALLRSAEGHSVANEPTIVSNLIGVHNPEKIKEIIEVLEEIELIKIFKGRIFSDLINEDMKKLDAKKENYRKASIKREKERNQNVKSSRILAESCQNPETNKTKILAESCQNLQVKDKVKDIVSFTNISNISNNNLKLNRSSDLNKENKENFDSEKVIESWNKVATEYSLPKINSLTKKRLQKFKARIKQAESPENFFSGINQAIEGSKFLRGESTDWKADFDFFLQESSYTRAVEGSYADSEAVQSVNVKVEEDPIERYKRTHGLN